MNTEMNTENTTETIVARKLEPTNKIDVSNLERLYLDVDARLTAQNTIIENLRNENLHLRQVIEMLITSKSPTL